MKRFITSVVALSVCMVLETRALAFEDASVVMESLSYSELFANADGALDWKVGDRADYAVSAGFLGKGTMTKEVTREEGDGIWVKQTMDAAGHAETIEKLYRKSDGAVLRVVRNGQEQNPEDSRVEVISTEDTTIQVPAGSFKTVHVVGKTKKLKKIEMWLNPADTAIDGTVKLIMVSSMYTITSELKSYQRAP